MAKSTSHGVTSIKTVKGSLYVQGIETINRLDIGECFDNMCGTP
jgi:hypothetical protein